MRSARNAAAAAGAERSRGSYADPSPTCSGSGSNNERWSSGYSGRMYSPQSTHNCGDGGGLGVSLVVPGALSRNLVYPGAAKNRQSTNTTTTIMMSGEDSRGRSQQERKPWLKPVSSLLRGIPLSKRGMVEMSGGEALGGGGNDGVPTSSSHMVPPVHMVPPETASQFPSRREMFLSAPSRGDNEDKIHRQSNEQQQQQQHDDLPPPPSPQGSPFGSLQGHRQAITIDSTAHGWYPSSSLGRDERESSGGSVSPRIVRGEDVFSPPPVFGGPTSRETRNHNRANNAAPGSTKMMMLDHGHARPLREEDRQPHHYNRRRHYPPPVTARRGVSVEDRVGVDDDTDSTRRMQGPFEPFPVRGLRVNDNFNCVSKQQQQRRRRQQQHQHQQHEHEHELYVRRRQLEEHQHHQQQDRRRLAFTVPLEGGDGYFRGSESHGVPPAVGVVAAPPPLHAVVGIGVGGVANAATKMGKGLCVSDGCIKRSSHARRGKKPSFCAEHRAGGMVDVVRRNRCMSPGCGKPPRYALPGGKAEYCSQHKRENYVDVKHPRCESSMGCVRQPTFGWEGEKARFCSAHKVDGMLDVKNPRCAEPGCIKRPRYGDEGERARFCAAHKFDDMVDLATRRGNKCSSPSKRARDGPRSAAHDSAAAIAAAATSTGAAAVSVSRRPSMPSFNLQTATSAPTSSTSAVGRSSSGPPPKRGNTVAHAGGHRRATSESWIDFCPKRLYDTSVKTGEEGSLAGVGIRSRRNRATGIAAHPTVNSDAKDRGVDGPPSGTFHFGSRGNGSANSSGSSFRAGAVAPRDTGNPSLSGRGGGSRAVGIVNITPLGGELTAEIPTSISASPAPSPSHSRTSSCLPSPSAAATTTGFSTSACSSTAPKSTAGTSKEKPHRFNAVDYEASAILLECRSGALLPRQQ